MEMTEENMKYEECIRCRWYNIKCKSFCELKSKDFCKDWDWDTPPDGICNYYYKRNYDKRR